MKYCKFILHIAYIVNLCEELRVYGVRECKYVSYFIPRLSTISFTFHRVGTLDAFLIWFQARSKPRVGISLYSMFKLTPIKSISNSTSDSPSIYQNPIKIRPTQKHFLKFYTYYLWFFSTLFFVLQYWEKIYQ